jgi:GNAT superfamily N-acetyltransferase
MSKLIPPASQNLEAPDFVLKRIKNHPEYHKVFIRSITEAIENDYAEITSSFASNLIKIDSDGYDKYGYFTLGKEVWVILEKPTGSLLGFEVVTRKRGGCIKIGPTFLQPEARHKGYATKMIELLCAEYAALGARKVYVTAPSSHKSTAILDFYHLHLSLEAILSDHYRAGSAERVCGRFLLSNAGTPSLRPRVELGKTTTSPLHLNINTLGVPDKVFSDFIIKEMEPSYDDIDPDFVNAILAGLTRDPDVFEQKGKVLFTLTDGERIAGVAVATSKRGGVFKVAPLLISDSYYTKGTISHIVEAIIHYATRISRKITILLPVRDWSIVNVVMKHQFVAEGVLRSPYKEGADVAVLSRLIDEK